MGRANQSPFLSGVQCWVCFFSGKLENVKVHLVTGYFYKENPQIVSQDKDLVDHWLQRSRAQHQ